MARPRKESISLNIKCRKDIALRLESYCAEVGQTKTIAVERMLEQGLDEWERKTNTNIAKLNSGVKMRNDYDK